MTDYNEVSKEQLSEFEKWIIENNICIDGSLDETKMIISCFKFGYKMAADKAICDFT